MAVPDSWASRPFAAPIVELWPRFWTAWTSDLRPDLPTVVGGYLSANEMVPINFSPVIDVALLEMIAHLIFKNEPRKIWRLDNTGKQTKDKLHAAIRARHVLEWAEVPLAIPTKFTHLSELRHVRKQNCDGPDALVYVRNKTVHMERRTRPGGLPRHRRSTRRRLGPRALVRHPRCPQAPRLPKRVRQPARPGAWEGTTEPVPWAGPTPPSEVQPPVAEDLEH